MSAIVLMTALSTPIIAVSIILIITSLILAGFILLHKSRGGGLSDLFGGGVSSSMGGVSTAERRLDRITTVVGLLWFLCIIALLILYKITF